MSAGLPSDLPFPARTFVILQVYYMPFVVVPLVQKGNFSNVIITDSHFDNLELLAILWTFSWIPLQLIP
jgi:hypothetical protein